MSATGTLLLQGSITGAPEGQVDVQLALTFSAATLVKTVGLVNGGNTINVPSGSTAVLIILPSNTVPACTLKGQGGDTGVPLLRTGWTLLGLDPSVVTINLTTTGAISGAAVLFL